VQDHEKKTQVGMSEWLIDRAIDFKLHKQKNRTIFISRECEYENH